MRQFVRYVLGISLLITVLWAAQLPTSSLAVTGEEAGFSYEIVSDTYCSITGYTGSETQLVIPAQLGGYPVQEIDSSAFRNNVTLESVTLPEGMTYIQSYAFRDCTALKSVSFPTTLTRIGSYAFEGCSALETADLPAGLERIDKNAFQNCISLTSAALPSSLVALGSYTFSGCSSLDTLTLGEGLTTIQSYTFENCTALEGVSLPASITSLAPRAFYNCAALTEVGYPVNWSTTSSSSGSTSPFDGCTVLTSVTVPEGVTMIPDYAFRNCAALETISLPDSLTSIGTYAFYGSGLTGLDLPNGLKTIDKYAFQNCVSLTSLSLPEGMTTLNSSAFEGCAGLTSVSVPGSLTTLGSSAFSGCSNLDTLTLGEGLTAIQSYTFENCTSLERVSFPASLTFLAPRAFYNCAALTEVGYPVNWSTTSSSSGSTSPFLGCTALTSVTVPEGATMIPAYAFRDCAALEAISLPSTLTSIGSYAFAGSGLTGLDLPNGLQTIDKYAFQNSASLTSLFLPEGLTTLGVSAFKGCAGLTSVSVPGSLTTLGSSAFSGCSSLETLTLGEGLTEIEGYAFENCTSLERVVLPASITSLAAKAFYNCTALTEIGYPAGWSKTTSSGGSTSPFVGCTALTSVTVPEGVTMIPDYAFRDCAALEAISLPESLVSIGSYAFYGSGLTGLDLPNGLKTIDKYAFQGCTGLTSLSLPEGLITLGSSAFEGCTGLTSVSVPGTLATLSSSAFSGCSSLETLTLGEGLTEIEGYAFEKCTALESVSLPASLTSLAAKAFYNCTALTEIGYPAGWSTTPYYSGYTSPFEGCSALTSVTVPQGVTVIPEYAFQNCTALETVSLPDSLTQIGAYAFAGSGLTRLDFPAGLKSINEYAFRDCDGLVTLVFNDGLETISGRAFSSCANLATVNIPRSVTTCASTSFASCPNLVICCYSGSAAHYAAESAGWTFVLLDQHKHTFVETVEQAPTCTKEGSARYTCSICGYSYTQTLAPLGHSYGEWIVDKEATYWQAGRMHRVCTRDGHVETQVIPKLEAGEGMGIACFTVVNAQTLEPLSGARISTVLEDGTEAAADTDADGKAQLPLPPGQYTVCVTAPDCQPRSFRITVTEGVTEVPTVGMSGQPVYDATVTSHLMTYEEILAAGIDVSAAGNQQVYKYELTLVFEPEIDWLSLTYYMGDSGFLFGGMGGGTGGGSGGGDGGGGSGGGDSSGGGSGSRTYVTWVSDGEGKGHFFLPAGTSGDGESLSIYPVSEYFYLIIRGEVRWLKEMFDVEMLVVNNSLTDTLEDLTATLELPEGLSLASMVGEPQTLSQSLPDLAGGKSHSVHWYVRGDTAGSYSLNARLQGKVMPFEEEINQVFTSENQLQVWAGNALHLHFEFPSSTYYNDDYPITVTLENVSDIPLYNLSHKVQIEQGMIYYYSDGSTKERIETSQWYSSGVLPVFRPGDKLIMEMTVNIFFKSEMIEQKLEKLIGMVDGAEQMLNAYKAVKAGVTAAQTLQKTVTNAITVLDGFDFNLQNEDAKKMELFSQLYKKLSALYSAYSSTGDKTLDSLLKLGSTGVTASLDAIAQDPGKWLKDTAYEDLSKLVKQVEALGNQLSSGGEETRKFDLFDSIRTLISAIPIRFVLSDVFMTGDEANTTSIPWSYSTTPDRVQYFGVTDLSRTLMSYIQYGFGSMYEDTVPGILQLVPGLDDPFHKGEAEEYLQTVQDQVTQLKATAASGSTTFRVWLERADSLSLLSDEEPAADFLLSCDSDTAKLENGVLTFTGDALMSVTPTSQAGGVLHIEDSDGHTYTYNLSVVAPHTCTPGAREMVVQPTEAYDGFAVRCCPVCGDILEVELLTTDDLCENHAFGPWETETEATHTAGGLQHRQCALCGAEEYRATETKPYTQEELQVTIGGDDAVLTNRSGEPAQVCMILAVYSSDGQLLDYRTAVEELEPGETLGLALPDLPGAGENAVVYLLDPLTLAPLIPAWRAADTPPASA